MYWFGATKYMKHECVCDNVCLVGWQAIASYCFNTSVNSCCGSITVRTFRQSIPYEALVVAASESMYSGSWGKNASTPWNVRLGLSITGDIPPREFWSRNNSGCKTTFYIKGMIRCQSILKCLAVSHQYANTSSFFARSQVSCGNTNQHVLILILWTWSSF